MTRMILDDYIADCDRFRAKYGARVLLLYQVGSFWEMYSYPGGGAEGAGDDGGDTVMLGADIHRVGDLLNIVVTRRNKGVAEVSRSNPYMAGFPLDAFDKYAPVLLGHGYTVVLVRQVTEPPNPRREVTEVLSPATQVAPGQQGSSYLMALFLDASNERGTGKRRFGLGMAAMDISTGAVLAYERHFGNAYYLDEAIRLTQAYSPKEVVLMHDPAVTEAEREGFCGAIGAGGAVLSYTMPYEPGYAKPAYQNLVFGKAWGASLLEPVEHIGLERWALARMAMVALLRFAADHNETLVRDLRMPQLVRPEGLLTLEYTSAAQLQVIGTGPSDPHLLSLLCRCATAFGARLFRERLLAPLSDPERLAERYGAVRWLLGDGKGAAGAGARWEVARRSLRRMLDLERMVRRLRLGLFHPSEWPGLHETLVAASALVEGLVGGSAEEAPEAPEVLGLAGVAEGAVRVRGGYEGVLDLDECSKHLVTDIRGNVFAEGVRPELDEMAATERKQMAVVLAAQEEATGAGGACTVEASDRDGYALLMTKKRWATARTQLEAAGYEGKPVSQAASAGYRVTSAALRAASARILENRSGFQRAATVAYRSWLARFAEDHGANLTALAEALAALDVAATSARNAHDFGYTEPVLARVAAGARDARDARVAAGAALEITGMRHPIIERVHEHVPFVANDAVFGGAAARGMLLYGINAAGKSSYMKAVGLNVLMAQAGMFVAADRMVYAPFRHLFTRIQSNDNLYRGMSTFVVEMTELRDILCRADAHSLVLGDELCAGTESVSGTAIVAAGIDHLLRSGACFLFATHLHELTRLPQLAEFAARGDLRVAHLHVGVGEDGVLVYDRTLREGPGSPVYGLEVCRALGLPGDFVRLAQQVRRYLQDPEGKGPVGIAEADPGAVSRYNRNVLMADCAICGARATETHHIRYQKDGGDHRASNLMPLCESCHHREHHGDLHIRGYVATSAGVRPDVVVREAEVQTEAPVAQLEAEPVAQPEPNWDSEDFEIDRPPRARPPMTWVWQQMRSRPPLINPRESREAVARGERTAEEVLAPYLRFDGTRWWYRRARAGEWRRLHQLRDEQRLYEIICSRTGLTEMDVELTDLGSRLYEIAMFEAEDGIVTLPPVTRARAGLRM